MSASAACGLRDPTRLRIEGVEIEPVRRLRDGDEIDACVREAAALRGRRAVLDPVMRLRVRDLLRARIRCNDARESLGKQDRQLPRTAPAIEREVRRR